MLGRFTSGEPETRLSPVSGGTPTFASFSNPSFDQTTNSETERLCINRRASKDARSQS